jgi:hypothetical protein
MEAVGLGITLLSGLAITVIGLLYLVRPRMIAAAFGLPTLPDADATAWLRVKGVRDLVTGVVAGVLLVAAPSHVIGWVMLAFALIPIGDAAVVIVARGRASAAWAMHGSTALVMIVGSVLLLVGSR